MPPERLPHQRLNASVDGCAINKSGYINRVRESLAAFGVHQDNFVRRALDRSGWRRLIHGTSVACTSVMPSGLSRLACVTHLQMHQREHNVGGGPWRPCSRNAFCHTTDAGICTILHGNNTFSRKTLTLTRICREKMLRSEAVRVQASS